jgi:hypothetical protein
MATATIRVPTAARNRQHVTKAPTI